MGGLLFDEITAIGYPSKRVNIKNGGKQNNRKGSKLEKVFDLEAVTGNWTNGEFWFEISEDGSGSGVISTRVVNIMWNRFNITPDGIVSTNPNTISSTLMWPLPHLEEKENEARDKLGSLSALMKDGENLVFKFGDRQEVQEVFQRVADKENQVDLQRSMEGEEDFLLKNDSVFHRTNAAKPAISY